jgi:SnoaL-like domain
MTDLHDRERALTTLLDEAACRSVISCYSAAVDWADREALTKIFWPDAKFDFGAAFFVGTGTAGIDFLIASVNASMCRTHVIGSIWLKLGRSEAHAETPAVNVWISRNPDGSITRYLMTARYLWELQKRQDKWGASSLRILINTAQRTPYELDAQPPGFQLLESLSVDHPLCPGGHD